MDPMGKKLQKFPLDLPKELVQVELWIRGPYIISGKNSKMRKHVDSVLEI